MQYRETGQRGERIPAKRCGTRVRRTAFSGQRPASLYGLHRANLGPAAMTTTHPTGLFTRAFSHTAPLRPSTSSGPYPEQKRDGTYQERRQTKARVTEYELPGRQWSKVTVG